MEHWIGQAVGKMHINKITQTQLAEEMGVTNDYVWMILNGKKSPKGIKERVENAIDSIILSRVQS